MSAASATHKGQDGAQVMRDNKVLLHRLLCVVLPFHVVNETYFVSRHTQAITKVASAEDNAKYVALRNVRHHDLPTALEKSSLHPVLTLLKAFDFDLFLIYRVRLFS